MSLGRAYRALTAAAALALCAAGDASAQPRAVEYTVKAAFLARFASFATWPAGAGEGPTRLCVIGDDPFGAVLDQAAAAQAGGGRSIVVVRLPAADPDAGCRIAYVAGSARAPVGDDLAAMRGEPVLTVTDAARGDTRGMIHFVVFQDRVRFQIDASQAARSGLSFSSKLLALAVSVKR